jgi:hypothetical protein
MATDAGLSVFALFAGAWWPCCASRGRDAPKGAFGQRFARRVLDHVFDDGRSPRARKPREWEGYEEGASPCALERRHREVYEAAVGHALPEPIPYCGWVVES